MSSRRRNRVSRRGRRRRTARRRSWLHGRPPGRWGRTVRDPRPQADRNGLQLRTFTPHPHRRDHGGDRGDHREQYRATTTGIDPHLARLAPAPSSRPAGRAAGAAAARPSTVLPGAARDRVRPTAVRPGATNPATGRSQARCRPHRRVRPPGVPARPVAEPGRVGIASGRSYGRADRRTGSLPAGCGQITDVDNSGVGDPGGCQRDREIPEKFRRRA